MTLRWHWWITAGAVLIPVYGIVSASLPKNSHALTAFGDITTLLMMVCAAIAATVNAAGERGQTRVFWSLIATGCSLWAVNQGLWTIYEVVLKREIPDPFEGDVILFVHVVPLIAAVALRPHQAHEERKLHLGTLNFLMLLIWWVFLYAFIIFPDEYISINKELYTRNYDWLYILENLTLLGLLLVFTWKAKGGWRKIYLNFVIACALYALSSVVINAAIVKNQYYSGSMYDVPLIASIWWIVWTCIQGRELKPVAESAVNGTRRWQSLAPRLAMLAVLSAPLLGLWALFADDLQRRQHFRLLVTLLAMLMMGVFVYARQYLLDRELLRLLEQSRESLENLQHVQGQLLQKEKLASLGQLVSGVAHEINNPLAAILGYSELLKGADLGPEQNSMADKIAHQARRTRDLVSRLLSFAQQAPAEKTRLDIGVLLQRALQVELLRMETQKITVSTHIAADLPPVLGNANQLLQCFLQIARNARDALMEVGGGIFSIGARREGDEIVVEFTDTGPGLRDPQRVFDPFYTTKPVGQGTGLGLSATYGVIQDHGGQITCQNQPRGGALFVLRFPVAKPELASEAELVEA